MLRLRFSSFPFFPTLFLFVHIKLSLLERFSLISEACIFQLGLGEIKHLCPVCYGERIQCNDQPYRQYYMNVQIILKALSSTYRPSVDLWGLVVVVGGYSYPSHLQTMGGLMYFAFSLELFNQYHQESRERPSTLYGYSPCPFSDEALSHSFSRYFSLGLLRSLWMGPTPPRGDIVWPQAKIWDPLPPFLSVCLQNHFKAE